MWEFTRPHGHTAPLPRTVGPPADKLMHATTEASMTAAELPSAVATALHAWPLRVQSHPKLGNFATASRTIAAGELVFTEAPFAQTVHDSTAEKVCHACYKALEGGVGPNSTGITRHGCTSCRAVRFCSARCAEALAPTHVGECDLLQDVGARGSSTLRLFVRLLRRGRAEPAALDAIERLTLQCDEADTERRAALEATADSINLLLPRSHQMTRGRLARLVDRVQSSALAVADVDGLSAGTALYVAGASVFNHSCSPSAVASFHGASLRIHATRELAPGEEVTISYTSAQRLHAGRAARQSTLRAERSFTCACERCTRPPATDALLDGWACASCADGVVAGDGARCAACGVAHALKVDARAAIEQRWSDDLDKWWHVLPGGGHATIGRTAEQAALAILPKVDQLLAASAARLCETHALRQRALILRAHAVEACSQAPPAARVAAIEACLRGMYVHCHPADPRFCSYLRRLAHALTGQAAVAAQDRRAAAALNQRACEVSHAAAHGLTLSYGADHPLTTEWRKAAAALGPPPAAGEGMGSGAAGAVAVAVAPAPPSPSPVEVWEPFGGFDELAFLSAHWPGWTFDEDRVTRFRREVAAFNRKMGKPSGEEYQGGLRLKIPTPSFLTFEEDWQRTLSDVVDVPAIRALVADLRSHHAAILQEYESVADSKLSDSGTHMLTGGRLWVEAFPQHLPTLGRLLRRHTECLSPARTDIGTVSPPTSHLLPPTCYLSPPTSYMLSLTSYLSPLTSHLSPRRHSC